MNCIIASSKKWFVLEDFQSNINVKFHFISKRKDLNSENLEKIQPNFIFFPHWNWYVEPKIFNNYNCVLFHTAPLPYGRGGSPIQNLILKGHESSPVCAIKMDESLDGGPIYLKKNISLKGSLREIFLEINTVVNQMIKEIIETKPKALKQIGKPVIFKRIDPGDNEIDNSLTIKELYDKIRMLDAEDYPKAFIKFGDYVLEFSSAKIVGKKINAIVEIKECK